jgi:hypothetical protein
MTGDASKAIGLLGALLPDLVQSLDADGFTVGTDTTVNGDGQTMYWVAMEAGSDLAVGSYVGNDLDDRSITGAGFQPDWIVTLGDGQESYMRPGTLAGDASFSMDGSGALADRIQGMEPDGFQVGTNANVNDDGVTYHYIAWDAGAAVSQGTYVGDGVDDRSITGVGFQPLLAWTKRDAVQQAVWRPASVSGDSSIYWGATIAGSNRIQALEPDGFQVGDNDQVNHDTGTFHYLALRDTP